MVAKCNDNGSDKACWNVICDEALTASEMTSRLTSVGKECATRPKSRHLESNKRRSQQQEYADVISRKYS